MPVAFYTARVHGAAGTGCKGGDRTGRDVTYKSLLEGGGGEFTLHTCARVSRSNHVLALSSVFFLSAEATSEYRSTFCPMSLRVYVCVCVGVLCFVPSLRWSLFFFFSFSSAHGCPLVLVFCSIVHTSPFLFFDASRLFFSLSLSCAYGCPLLWFFLRHISALCSTQVEVSARRDRIFFRPTVISGGGENVFHSARDPLDNLAFGRFATE